MASSPRQYATDQGELWPARAFRIAIDAHMIGTGETGNETYIRGLVRGLQQVTTQHEYLLYTTDPALLPARLLGERFRARQVAPAGNIPRLAYGMPRAARQDRLDLLHVTYTLPLFLPCRTVVSVHDISYVFFPEAFSPRDRVLLSLAVPLSMRRADRVLTISEHARRDIVQHYRVPEWKVTAIPLAAEEHFQPVAAADELARVRARYRLPERYILAVGNLQPRKNLRRLIEAFATLRAAGTITQRLVLVGKNLWRESEVFAAIRARGLVDEVVATGYVPDADLPAIYSAADVFVYPSLYEGFGVPPLEAMSCGTPVIASNSSSLPEVVGDAALLVDPTNTGELTAALERLLTDEVVSARLRVAGRKQAARFSWTETARRTLAVYEEVIARGARR
jgi:glycosyltransferase involved in cell wall biosynthesis